MLQFANPSDQQLAEGRCDPRILPLPKPRYEPLGRRIALQSRNQRHNIVFSSGRQGHHDLVASIERCGVGSGGRCIDQLGQRQGVGSPPSRNQPSLQCPVIIRRQRFPEQGSDVIHHQASCNAIQRAAEGAHMPNRLANATSPYLLQHAHNPVDWYPWGEEALQRAKNENKPILLSVGYSACHWCHVMERESFEDEATAALMNKWFVNIKVDREERPDIDDIYMRAVQALSNGHGGWPMTVVMTPSGRPFFGGTYFPNAPRHGMPSFQQVLRQVAKLWDSDPGRVGRLTEQLTGYLNQTSKAPEPTDDPTDTWLTLVSQAADGDFDSQNGGFGQQPKFPPHGTLAALLAHWRTAGHPRSLAMVTKTLDGMAKGGMYDLLGGGFARYSVDAEWRIPHFEKMLFDNAQLATLYTDAWKVTGKHQYRRVVEETLEWALREMRLPEGGFSASQDADSEGVEGRFFAWTPQQVRDVLGTLEASLVCRLLQVSDRGTFEHGSSVLRLDVPYEELDAEHRDLLLAAMPKLFEARSKRVAPPTDTKVVTAWNAWMISSLARASSAFERSDWLLAASDAARFLEESLVISGRLQRTWKDGRAHVPAFSDDYAGLVVACLDLYEAGFDPYWLERANHWADELIRLFWDDEEGAMFYTGTDAEKLVTRGKRFVSGAEPSGNALAAMAFTRLAALSGRDELGSYADRILAAYQTLLQRAPRALGIEAIAGLWRARGGMEIGIEANAGDGGPLLAEVRRRYLPLAVVARLLPDQDRSLTPFMADRTAEVPTAWVCEGFSCQLPTADDQELGRQLDRMAEPAPSRLPEESRPVAPELPSDPALWLNTESVPSIEGKVVVLDFWTYCCINCMHVLPELEAIERKYGSAVQVIGVHSPKFSNERDLSQVMHAIERHRIGHPVLQDVQHTLWKALGVRSWPTVVVIDPQGRVAWTQPGEVHRDALSEVIDGMLGTQAEPTEAVELTVTPELRYPGKVHVAERHLYVSDTGNDRIVEYGLTAGSDGWPVITRQRDFAGFHMPQGIHRLGDRLFVADTDSHALKSIDLVTGAVSTLAGTGALGRGGEADPSDPTGIPLRSPWDVAALETSQGAVVFIAMAGTHQVWVYIEQRNEVGPFAGNGAEDHIDGPLARAAFAQPSALSMTGHYLFVADAETSSVRAVDLDKQVVATLVGQGLFDFGDVDGDGDDVRMQHPLGIAAAHDRVYVADTFNHKVKAIDMQRKATTLAGGTTDVFNEPGGLDVWEQFLIVADTNNHRVRALHAESGEVRTIS
jgi:uncharacterized protein